MFFKQLRRNAAKNRKGNGLFFGALVIAIIAFYTLLSLGKQDVMRYLSTLESAAVEKLMMMLPVVYVISLFFVFFLVYFACKYQTDSRRQELGMYLMLGMKRGRLFAMLFCETLWNSVISLIIGLPVALLLTEGISFATAKTVGIGIIGHQFSISATALFWTTFGFVLVQLLSMLIICIGLGKAEPVDLLRSGDTENQTMISGKKSAAFFIVGLGFLFIAYYLGMFKLKALSVNVLIAIVVCGIAGTFLLYRGLGGFLGIHIRKKSPNALGLQTFTARQVQENVLSQHKSLAVSSLLLTIALSCISFGIPISLGRSARSHSVDFSLFGKEDQINAVLERDDVRKMVKGAYPLQLSRLKDRYFSKDTGLRNNKNTFNTEKLLTALASVDEAAGIIDTFSVEYVISESSYNRILKNMGKEEIKFTGHQVAFYSSGGYGSILESALKKEPVIGIDGIDYEIISKIYYDNIVADRAIRLSIALIVSDELFTKLAREPKPYCQNVFLSDEVVADMGLMQAVQKMDKLLSNTGLKYDSFLGGIGRNLLYNVAASYLTVYLAILFWLIANTVIGLKYLISQRQTKRRYETLTLLGAEMPAMCRSVKKQIGTYFSLVLCIALVSSAAAVCTMFTSFTKLSTDELISTIATPATVVLAVFVVIEFLYISIVKRTAVREVNQL